jgi:hypothetical protein
MFEEETIQVTCAKCGHEGQGASLASKLTATPAPRCGASFYPNQLAWALKQTEGVLRYFF